VTITEALERFGCFHDWYLDIISTRNDVDPRVPDTFILGLFDRERRATITFRGVTRVGIENGGLLNIVNAIETVRPGSEPYKRAMALLERSAHGERRAEYVAYLFSTVGAEIAVEFDSLRIESA
jgi:hypothetical protein